MDISQVICLEDFAKIAEKKLSPEVFNYINSGKKKKRKDGDGVNKAFLRKLMIIPRVLKGFSEVGCQSILWGHRLKLPFGFAPWASAKFSHPDGECAVARVAQEQQIPFVLSVYSHCSLQQVAAANKKGFRLLQLYLTSNWETTLRALRLAQTYGFVGIVLTVDAPILFGRSSLSLPNEQHKVLTQICGQRISGSQFLKRRDLHFNWNTVRKVRQATTLKIVLKGILHPEDVKLAIPQCDAIWLSNHGERQLDCVPSVAQQLRAIISIKREIPIFVDGGVSIGDDVLKYLALGANYVFMGRLAAFALVEGQPGLRLFISILEDEFRRTLILTGLRDISEAPLVDLMIVPGL